MEKLNLVVAGCFKGGVFLPPTQHAHPHSHFQKAWRSNQCFLSRCCRGAADSSDAENLLPQRCQRGMPTKRHGSCVPTRGSPPDLSILARTAHWRSRRSAGKGSICEEKRPPPADHSFSQVLYWSLCEKKVPLQHPLPSEPCLLLQRWSIGGTSPCRRCGYHLYRRRHFHRHHHFHLRQRRHCSSLQ